MSVSSNSATAGAGFSSTSTIVVSATGGNGLPRLFRAVERLALATPVFGLNLVTVRLAVLPRTDLEDLRTLSRPVDFLFRPVTRFLR